MKLKQKLFKGIITCFLIGLATFATASQNISGKVLETMDAGGYTYLKVDTDEGQPWVAIPQSQVNVGDEISYQPGMVMNNFSSKTLNKTFDAIVFSPGLAGNNSSPHGAAAMGMGGMQNPHKKAAANSSDDSFAQAIQNEGNTPAPGMEPATASGGSLGAIAPFAEIKIDKADGDNAYSVDEIFAQAEQLNGKIVRIKGKVVKFSPSIMGRNWIHLQDGTGDPMKNTHDLVVTSSQQVETAAVVTMEGTLAANKDFGAGYKYVVIIEEATTVE